MNLELTDEQLALRDTVRRFLTEKASLPTHVRTMLDDPTGTTDEVWRGLAGLGATGVLVPQEFGGSGMTMVEAGVVAEELAAPTDVVLVRPQSVHDSVAAGELMDHHRLLAARAHGAGC